MTTERQQYRPLNRTHGSWVFALADLTIGTADFVTGFTPGFAGSIVRTYALVVTTITSGGTASIAINLEIGAVDLVGGVVSITTNATRGTYVNGTLVTGSQNFDNDDTISVENTETVAPTGGMVLLVVEYEVKVLQ